MDLEHDAGQIAEAVLEHTSDPLASCPALVRVKIGKREIVRSQPLLGVDEPVHRRQNHPRPTARLRVCPSAYPQRGAIQSHEAAPENSDG
jgi:hypothetical protein